MRLIRHYVDRLFDPIDIAPLVFFRIAFGGIMLWEVWRYFHFDRIARYYVEPTYVFHYFGFQWLQPLPGDGMFMLFHFLGALSVAILVGAFYRLSMTLFWLCFTYIFLLDKAQYLNHFYLISLVSFLMIFIPANRAYAVDAWLRPGIRSQIAPNWSLWLLRGQLAVVYVFGGLAKINPDWLAGEPMREWLGARTDFPVIGAFFTEEWAVYLFSYGGLFLDLLAVPLLLWKRTRIPALVLVTAFHLTNARLFNIGIFPWFALAASLLLLPPAWFRPRFLKSVTTNSKLPETATWQRRVIVSGMVCYFAVQIFLPLRHLLYPGDPSWTEEGHTLAWHMRLRDKDGDIRFYASDPANGITWQLSVEEHLSRRQFNQMKDNPPMILRFVNYLEDIFREDYADIQIHVWSMMSLNSRPAQLLIDPTADLTRQPDDLLASDWILPLVQQPVPQARIPALLVSRRYQDVLLLVNIAESPFPIDAIMLGMDDYQLSGAEFGISELMPGECLLASSPGADLREVFVPCRETGQHLIVDPVLLEERIIITTTTGQQHCGGIRCVVTERERQATAPVAARPS